MRRTVLALAPAKLNLALAVGPPRPDGMHPVCSWMVAVDLVDELIVTRLEEQNFSRYAVLWHDEARRRSEIDWPITADLAVRAHQALERHVGRSLPVQLKLEKRIPVGAGLGGGSSDAAAMLRALDQLFDLGLGRPELAAIGATIGADVSFLVHGGSALVEGVGEQIQVLPDLPDLNAVVVLPDATCPTGAVYRQFDQMPGSGYRPDAVKALAGAAPKPPVPQAIFNDLALAALRVAPAMRPLLAALEALAERPAAVCGSGAALFVLCDDALHAGALAAAAEQRLGAPAIAVRAIDPEALHPTETVAAAAMDRAS